MYAFLKSPTLHGVKGSTFCSILEAIRSVAHKFPWDQCAQELGNRSIEEINGSCGVELLRDLSKPV